MSNPYWSARYVPDRAQLPERLERGRAYFVGDEQIVIVDYGSGPIEYGNKPGPQGIPGEPLPQLQAQIDDLADASINTTANLFDTNQRVLNSGKKLSTEIKNTNLRINEETTRNIQNFSAVNERIDTSNERIDESAVKISDIEADIEQLVSDINDRFEKIDNVISIVVKLIASLYPDAHKDMKPDEPPKMRALAKDEILSSENGSYRVSESYLSSDGGLVVKLDLIEDSDQALILTLKDGDEIVTSGSERWIVSGYNLENEQGVMTLSYAGSQTLIETLKPGDIVEYDSGSFTVDEVTEENGAVVIKLTAS